MASFNRCILIGNLTQNVELKQSTSGVSVCSFSIAINRKMAKNNECDYINIVAWRQQAEFVTRYFKKGNPILVCGQLQTRTWTDNNGQKRYATEVVADEVSFVASANNADKPSANQSNQGAYTPAAYGGTNGPNFEEIPNDEQLPF